MARAAWRHVTTDEVLCCVVWCGVVWPPLAWHLFSRLHPSPSLRSYSSHVLINSTQLNYTPLHCTALYYSKSALVWTETSPPDALLEASQFDVELFAAHTLDWQERMLEIGQWVEVGCVTSWSTTLAIYVLSLPSCAYSSPLTMCFIFLFSFSFALNSQPKEQRLLISRSGTSGTAPHVRMRRRRGRCLSEATHTRRKSQTNRRISNETSSACRKQSETWVHRGMFLFSMGSGFFLNFSASAQSCIHAPSSIFNDSTYVRSTHTDTFRFMIIPGLPERVEHRCWTRDELRNTFTP